MSTNSASSYDGRPYHVSNPLEEDDESSTDLLQREVTALDMQLHHLTNQVNRLQDEMDLYHAMRAVEQAVILHRENQARRAARRPTSPVDDSVLRIERLVVRVLDVLERPAREARDDDRPPRSLR
ncbi:hypothetical protein LTR37_020897 [Vermiconidia calcicola]|uniref:Uncharacterized protein n=1 Tax=Vermiconidia calcicola TaxID=1690605 RepID=A0ACC3MBE1_9PEZI|nr:hypothetical protein LTR37_020897 [Vermiconidia calcicola]